MRKNNGLFVLILGLGIIRSCVHISALDMQNICLKTQGTPATYRSTTKVNDKVDKREEVNIERCEFTGNLSNSDYKYVKVHKDVAYLNSNNNKTIALVDMRSTFRYNTKMRVAKCLSSFTRKVVLNPSYSMNVSSRNANKNTAKGSGLMNVEFKSSLGKVLDKSTLEIDCDHTGHITSGNIELK